MKVFKTIFSVLVLLTLQGCQSRAPTPPAVDSFPSREDQRVAIKRIDLLQGELLTARQQAIENEKANGRWKSIACLLGGVCILAFSVGAVLGSEAKKNAK